MTQQNEQICLNYKYENYIYYITDSIHEQSKKKYREKIRQTTAIVLFQHWHCLKVMLGQ